MSPTSTTFVISLLLTTKDCPTMSIIVSEQGWWSPIIQDNREKKDTSLGKPSDHFHLYTYDQPHQLGMLVYSQEAHINTIASNCNFSFSSQECPRYSSSTPSNFICFGLQEITSLMKLVVHTKRSNTKVCSLEERKDGRNTMYMENKRDPYFLCNLLVVKKLE